MLPSWIVAQPALGLLVWWLVLGVRAEGGLPEADLAELLVLFMVLVAVPLALPQAVRTGRSEGPGAYAHPRLLAGLMRGIYAAGLLLAVDVLILETGGPAAIVPAAAWLLATAAAAVLVLVRLRTRVFACMSERVLDLALVFLPGGAVWLLVYRADLVLGGFGGLAAALTAAHFHTAGFGALVVTGLVGRGLAAAGMPRARRVHAVVAAAMVVAYAAMAAGIATGVHAFELTGAGLYAVALPAIAGLQAVAAGRLTSGLPRAALVLSSLCLLVSTAYALKFAAQGFYGAAVPIATMLRMHGAVNAVGFAGLALFGWSRVAAPALDDRVDPR